METYTACILITIILSVTVTLIVSRLAFERMLANAAETMGRAIAQVWDEIVDKIVEDADAKIIGQVTGQYKTEPEEKNPSIEKAKKGESAGGGL